MKGLLSMANTHRPTLVLLLLLAWAIAPSRAQAQAGVLLVEGRSEPDPSRLALADMSVRIHIDHLHATVRVTQVFENRTGGSLRGRYELALGRGAAVSSFALWEGEHRRAAVVVERERGRRIFEQLTRQNLDPGLLETNDDEPSSNVYAVRVDPIPGHNRIRVEVGYSQPLELAADEGLFVFPLGARDYADQTAGHLEVEVEVEGAWPLDSVELRPEALQPAEGSQSPAGSTSFRAHLDGTDVALTEDIMISLRLGRQPGSPLRPVLLTYRKPLGSEGRVDRTAFGAGRRYTDDRGYFSLTTPAQFAETNGNGGPPQEVVVALDTSLSMRGSTLEGAVSAVEGLLAKLRPVDRFGLVLFNDQVTSLEGGLQPATKGQVEKARRFFRSSYLSGGTDLAKAVPAALSQLRVSKSDSRTVVLITDGQPTLGAVKSTSLAKTVAQANKSLGAKQARLFVLGVGDDANHLALDRLANESDGLYAHVGEGSDIAPVLRGFIHQLTSDALRDLRATFGGLQGIEDLYPAAAVRVFDGSAHVLYGRYKTPTANAKIQLAGNWRGRPIQAAITAPLPERDTSRRWVARAWAQRRIEHLLALIDAQGERDEWVREIVALAREYMLVTPYTSLIAAARSLLRPREIQPGDPVLRVRADPSDRAVTAIFPFGLIKPLRELEPGLFETRFLAPPDLEQGRHDVDLVITSANGEVRHIQDYFVIDSQAPTPQIDLPDRPARAGQTFLLKVRTDRDTRRLNAHFGDGPPTPLRWSSEDLACVGEVAVDPSLPTGQYQLVVVAEDHAHNVGSATAELEVMGR